MEKTAKMVDFSHDRWELCQNPRIKAFASNYFLSERFPEIPLLENVGFSLFSVLITSRLLGSAKPWRSRIPMDLHYLSV
jgi:hypothetical protein